MSTSTVCVQRCQRFIRTLSLHPRSIFHFVCFYFSLFTRASEVPGILCFACVFFPPVFEWERKRCPNYKRHAARRAKIQFTWWNPSLSPHLLDRVFAFHINRMNRNQLTLFNINGSEEEREKKKKNKKRKNRFGREDTTKLIKWSNFCLLIIHESRVN